MITCIFENGTRTSLRHVTVNAIIIKDNQVLMGKRGTYKGKPMLESGKWGLVGGYLNRDENIIQAVKREAMEETGWEITDLRLFRINGSPQRPHEDRQNVDVIFIAQAVKQVGKSDEEMSQLQWFDLDNLPPIESIAFDHLENLELYKKYLKQKFSLPLL